MTQPGYAARRALRALQAPSAHPVRWGQPGPPLTWAQPDRRVPMERPEPTEHPALPVPQELMAHKARKARPASPAQPDYRDPPVQPAPMV